MTKDFNVWNGDVKFVQKFIVKLRTENVDIDSRGRSCKERLLTQIVELNIDQTR